MKQLPALYFRYDLQMISKSISGNVFQLLYEMPKDDDTLIVKWPVYCKKGMEILFLKKLQMSNECAPIALNASATYKIMQDRNSWPGKITSNTWIYLLVV